MCPVNTFFHFVYILLIFYLIKGTGKTLIGCMVVSKMLEQNPTRQVIFLVDRGLLVLQQYQYIKRELGDIIFTR
jgi:ERCC4-related helicase